MYYLGLFAPQEHPEFVYEQKAPVAKTRLSMEALRETSVDSVGRRLALAVTTTIVFDRDSACLSAPSTLLQR